MPRRLTPDARRERMEQERLQLRISAAARRALQLEINRSMLELLDAWDATGVVPRDDEHKRRVSLILGGLYSASVRSFGERLESAIGQRLTDEFYDAVVNAYIAEHVLVADDIADTTRELLRRSIQSGQRQGLPDTEIVDKIRSVAPGVSKARAALITRTETHGSANFGLLETAKRSGLITRKEWVPVEDHRTREDPFDHVNASQIVLIDEPFIVSDEELMYPGDTSASPGNFIACRCAQIFLVED
jgi:hypothetical protein